MFSDFMHSDVEHSDKLYFSSKHSAVDVIVIGLRFKFKALNLLSKVFTDLENPAVRYSKQTLRGF